MQTDKGTETYTANHTSTVLVGKGVISIIIMRKLCKSNFGFP